MFEEPRLPPVIVFEHRQIGPARLGDRGVDRCGLVDFVRNGECDFGRVLQKARRRRRAMVEADNDVDR